MLKKPLKKYQKKKCQKAFIIEILFWRKEMPKNVQIQTISYMSHMLKLIPIIINNL